MATRVVEGKKPYTGGEAIDIDQNKVISLKLRDENNLIIYDSGDDEIYVDLQLPDGITPTDAFPVGVTTGRAVVADGWDKAGTIICAKTTSGDNIKLLYADDGTLWIDNGTGTFKEIPLGGSAGADIEYVTQVEYDALPSSKLTDGKHYVIYTSDSPTPPSPWTPGANTIARWKLDGDTTDEMGNFDLSTRIGSLTYGTLSGGEQYGIFDGNTALTVASVPNWTKGTVSMWCNKTASGEIAVFVQNLNQDNSDAYTQMIINDSVIGFWVSSGPTNLWNYSYALNTWRNVVMTQDGNGINLYVDGQSVGSTFANSSWFDYNSSSDQLCVGGLVRGTQSYSKANGYLSNVILESEARTAQEVADYYNQTKANYGIS